MQNGVRCNATYVFEFHLVLGCEGGEWGGLKLFLLNLVFAFPSHLVG